MSDAPKYTNEHGEVAILYAPGFGAGWYSWNRSIRPSMLFDPELIRLHLQNATQQTIEEYCKAKWPDAYLGGLDQVTVTWRPAGTKFIIKEYDGYESIITLDELDIQST